MVASFATPFRRPLAPLALALALAALAFAPRAQAQVWNETGDAGDLPGSAQTTVGTGPLSQINGNLASPTDVDMYCIQVPDPASFSACLLCVVIQGPHLWLFNASGQGVAGVTACQGGCQMITGALLPGPGMYFVAVAYDGVLPMSPGGPIWAPGIYTTQRPPDGPGAPGPVTAWAGNPNVVPLNPYTINFGGTGFCSSATPAHRDTWGRLRMLYR